MKVKKYDNNEVSLKKALSRCINVGINYILIILMIHKITLDI